MELSQPGFNLLDRHHPIRQGLPTSSVNTAALGAECGGDLRQASSSAVKNGESSKVRSVWNEPLAGGFTPWLFIGIFRGLYYPVIYYLFAEPYRDPYETTRNNEILAGGLKHFLCLALSDLIWLICLKNGLKPLKPEHV